MIRTGFLLEYICNSELRQIIQAAQNKCEGFNQFAQWAYFGADAIEEVVFYIWILHQNPKFVAIDKEADDDIMHFLQLGETNGLANQPFDPRPQG